MNQRIYDLEKYLKITKDEEWVAEFDYPFGEPGSKEFFEWLESFTTSPYIALCKNIYFSSEEDRNFFLLAYKEDRFSET